MVSEEKSSFSQVPTKAQCGTGRCCFLAWQNLVEAHSRHLTHLCWINSQKEHLSLTSHWGVSHADAFQPLYGFQHIVGAQEIFVESNKRTGESGQSFWGLGDGAQSACWPRGPCVRAASSLSAAFPLPGSQHHTAPCGGFRAAERPSSQSDQPLHSSEFQFLLCQEE